MPGELQVEKDEVDAEEEFAQSAALEVVVVCGGGEGGVEEGSGEEEEGYEAVCTVCTLIQLTNVNTVVCELWGSPLEDSDSEPAPKRNKE